MEKALGPVARSRLVALLLGLALGASLEVAVLRAVLPPETLAQLCVSSFSPLPQ